MLSGPGSPIFLLFELGEVRKHRLQLGKALAAEALTRRLEVQPSGLMRLMAPMIRRMLDKGSERNLQSLKRVLEAS